MTDEHCRGSRTASFQQQWGRSSDGFLVCSHRRRDGWDVAQKANRRICLRHRDRWGEERAERGNQRPNLTACAMVDHAVIVGHAPVCPKRNRPMSSKCES